MFPIFGRGEPEPQTAGAAILRMFVYREHKSQLANHPVTWAHGPRDVRVHIDGCLLQEVAPANGFGRIATLNWSEELDGVVVSHVDDGVISGEGEWDPPGGWQPFRILFDSGQDAK